MARRVTLLWPALAAVLVSGAFSGLRLARAGWNAEALAEIGTRYSEGDPNGSEGYDGQFVLYVARDPSPATVAPHLDRPAYRYQRILLPLLARLGVLGNAELVAWAILAVGLAAHFAGTLAVGGILGRYGHSTRYALAYGLWAGLVVGVGTFLHEPLAYALVAGGWALRLRGRHSVGAVLLGLALFAKETTLVFWTAALIEDLLSRGTRRSSALALAAAGGLFVLWQVWLWRVFGEFGLGSGGAAGTPFEWIPFMGLLRVGGIDLKVLALYIVIFGPTIVVPAVWGIVTGVRSLLARRTSAESWLLLLNAGVIAFLPFSSFREPLALLRLASGLVLATVLFAAAKGERRVLNYSMFWCAMLVVLVRG